HGCVCRSSTIAAKTQPSLSVRTLRCIIYSDASFRSRVARRIHRRDEPTKTVFRVLTRENLARLDGERKSSPGLTRFMSQVGQFNVKTVPRAPARVVLAAPESRRRRLVGRTSRRDAFRNRARPRRADADKSAHAL